MYVLLDPRSPIIIKKSCPEVEKRKNNNIYIYIIFFKLIRTCLNIMKSVKTRVSTLM